jgi:hypothetical protein
MDASALAGVSPSPSAAKSRNRCALRSTTLSLSVLESSTDHHLERNAERGGLGGH